MLLLLEMMLAEGSQGFEITFRLREIIVPLTLDLSERKTKLASLVTDKSLTVLSMSTWSVQYRRLAFPARTTEQSFGAFNNISKDF